MPEKNRPYHRLESIKQIKRLSPEEIFKKTQRVRETFIGIPIFEGLDGYPYSNFTLTDFSPPMDATLVENMADLLIFYGNWDKITKIVSEADRGGGALTQALALKTGIPYTLANWYPVPAEGSRFVAASVGFSGQGNIAINGIERGDNIVLVDDLLSSGGTAEALIETIREAGAHIEQALFVGEKVNIGGRERIQKKFPDIKITSLVRFISKIENGVTIDADN